MIFISDELNWRFLQINLTLFEHFGPNWRKLRFYLLPPYYWRENDVGGGRLDAPFIHLLVYLMKRSNDSSNALLPFYCTMQL